jgi:hypothetical protein
MNGEIDSDAEETSAVDDSMLDDAERLAYQHKLELLKNNGADPQSQAEIRKLQAKHRLLIRMRKELGTDTCRVLDTIDSLFLDYAPSAKKIKYHTD